MVIEEGDRVLFDPISRGYIWVSLTPRARKGGEGVQGQLLSFRSGNAEPAQSFVVDAQFRLAYAEADELLALYRATAPP